MNKVSLTITSTQATFETAPKTDFAGPQPERRKNRRFPLRQPAVILSKGVVDQELSAFTLNACVEGVLLTAETSIPVGWDVHVAISMQKDGLESVRLRGTGKVVRSEVTPTGRFGIAVKFDKAMTSA